MEPTRRHRLVAFDVDGTLVSSRDGKVVWQLLNQRFGATDQEEQRRFKAYLRREISYAEWVDLDIGEWREAGATRAQMEEVIREHLFLVPGAREALDSLRQRGYRLAVISGTLDLTLELLFPSHPFEAVFTNRIWFDAQGRILRWAATPFDMDGKARGLEELARTLAIPLVETAYVGDNINDIQVLEAAGLAIAFEPKHPSVTEAADHVVEGDLRGLLDLL